MKKGYTLIEVIIVLTLMTIVSSITIIGVKFYSNNLQKINNKNISANIITFVNDAKLYCKTNKQSGDIILDQGSIRFIINSTTISRYTLPEGHIIETKISMSISDNGTSSKGNTVIIKDKKGNKYEFTITVQTTAIKEK